MKTIKDLEIENNFEGIEHDNPILEVDKYVRSDDLRQSAIEDIKRLGLEKEGKVEWSFLNFQASDKEYDAIIKYIKYKNDITEEDLK